MRMNSVLIPVAGWFLALGYSALVSDRQSENGPVVGEEEEEEERRKENGAGSGNGTGNGNGNGNGTVLVAQLGSNPLLRCGEGHLLDGTISWMRSSDHHLLTVGPQTYSPDLRFKAVKPHASAGWGLQIRYVAEEDEGWYECLIATHPPTSVFVKLKVVRARAVVGNGGGEEIHVRAGSVLELDCGIEGATEPPEYIFWYHGDRMINFDHRPGLHITNHHASSSLELRGVEVKDSGNFTCHPSNAQPASVIVHVLNGEHPAAMQHGSHSAAPASYRVEVLLSLTLLFLHSRYPIQLPT